MDEGRADRTCPRCGRTTAPRDGRAPRYCATCGQALAGGRRTRAAEPPTPPAASAALLLGLFSLIPMAGIVFAMLAIPLGLNATRQIDKSGGRYGGRGMAIAGVVLSLVASVLWVFLCCGGGIPG